MIDTGAVVNADISAERVLIRGKVKGNVVGRKMIFVTSAGSLDGDISTSKVVLEPGCIFKSFIPDVLICLYPFLSPFTL